MLTVVPVAAEVLSAGVARTSTLYVFGSFLLSEKRVGW